MGSRAKTFLLILLLLFIDLSVARFLGIQEGHVLPNPPDELIIYEVEMRKLTEMEAMVDYQKDPKPNPKHEPPKKPGGVRDGKTRANSLHEAIAAMEMRKLVETAEVQDYYCRSEPKHQQRGFRGGGDISRSLLNLLLAQNFSVLKGLLRVESSQ